MRRTRARRDFLTAAKGSFIPRLLLALLGPLSLLGPAGWLGLAGLAGPAGAVPHIHFSPDTLIAAPGDEPFEWAIWIDGGEDSIACFSVTMALDPDRLRLVASAEGDLFANCGSMTFFVSDSLSPAETRFIDCVLGYRTFVLGPGEIVRLTLEALSPGPVVCEVLLGEAIVTDIDRQEIPGVQVASGWLRLNTASAVEEPIHPAPRAWGSLRAWPSPSMGRVHIEWLATGTAGLERPAATSAPDRVRALLFDPAGRRVGEVPLRLEGARATATWTGGLEGGRRAPPGLYLLALDPPGLAAPARLLLLDSGGGR